MSFVSTIMITLALVAPGQLGAVKTGATDATIVTKIETTYLLNDHLSAFEINTSSNGGVVTLRGGVETEIQKDLAYELALAVGGVKQVNNQLTVVPDVKRIGPKRSFKTKVEDKTITASVRVRLLSSDNLRGLKLHPKTENGIVTLTGLVRSEFQREKVEHITYQTKGVERVINHLTISSKEDPKVLSTAGDELLEKRIETSMLLNRNVSARGVNVEVDDGIAYLTGIVNSQPEKEVAGDLAASTSGVHKVVNRLTIQGQEAPSQPATEKGPSLLEPLEKTPKIESLAPSATAPATPSTPTPVSPGPPEILEGDKPLFP
jgi:osmotically-inducible protein OsmY